MLILLSDSFFETSKACSLFLISLIIASDPLCKVPDLINATTLDFRRASSNAKAIADPKASAFSGAIPSAIAKVNIDATFSYLCSDESFFISSISFLPSSVSK